MEPLWKRHSSQLDRAQDQDRGLPLEEPVLKSLKDKLFGETEATARVAALIVEMQAWSTNMFIVTSLQCFGEGKPAPHHMH